MTTQYAPHPYPIAGVRGVTIGCQEDETTIEWMLRCPHGGVAAFRVPRPADDADPRVYNALVALVAVWRQREAAGFRNLHACDCGLPG